MKRKNTEFGNMKKKSKDYIDGMKRAVTIASKTEEAAGAVGATIPAVYIDKATRLIQQEIRILEK